MAVSVAGKRKLALMGEFSAGKSTLTNLLLGTDPMPTRVTATRLPPVWLTHGSGPAQRIDHDNQVHELPDGMLECVNPESTRLVRLEVEAEILEVCDLIDFPGISDPNMPSGLWQSAMDDVDQVVWCTHATQAWRQSEAAAWEAVMDKTNGNNLLLVTQIDKLTSDRDRNRVMARVRAETEGLFAGLHGFSLLEALKAEEDTAWWQESGAAAFIETLVDLLFAPANASLKADTQEAPAQVEETAAQEEVDEDTVLPRRVSNRPGGRLRTRPLLLDPGLASPAALSAVGGELS